MPTNSATAVLFNETNLADIVSVLTWTQNVHCLYPVNQFYSSIVNAQSITLQNRNGYEHLLWSGNDVGNPQSPLSLMTQRGEIGGGYKHTCHSNKPEHAYPVVLGHASETKSMYIQCRFAYDDVTYPVIIVPFDPEDIDKEMKCIKQ